MCTSSPASTIDALVRTRGEIVSIGSTTTKAIAVLDRPNFHCRDSEMAIVDAVWNSLPTMNVKDNAKISPESIILFGILLRALMLFLEAFPNKEFPKAEFKERFDIGNEEIVKKASPNSPSGKAYDTKVVT